MTTPSDSEDRSQIRKTNTMVGRRKFLTAATALAAASLPAKKAKAVNTASPAPGAARSGANAATLAVDGGTPVRATRLRANFPGPLYYDEEERRELLEVLDRRAPFRWYGVGPKGGDPDKCNQFEKEFAAHTGTKYCVAVTSGTAALITAVAALDVGPGDEVILPSWTWHSCYDAVIVAGATPSIPRTSSATSRREPK